MAPSDDILSTLRQMAADESLSASQRLRAIEQLERRSPPEPPPVLPPSDPEAVMAALVERLCPQPSEMAGAEPDPMRDLDAAEQLRQAGRARTVDVAIWGWLPYCPTRVADAERQVLQAVRRLGLAAGPLRPPGDHGDELAARRSRRGEGVA